nr:PAS domain-containing protein [Pedobacter sp. SYSU D00535]
MLDLRQRAVNLAEIEQLSFSAFAAQEQDLNWVYDRPDFRVLNVKCRRLESEGLRGVLWVFEDITEKVRSEETLREKTAALERSNEELAWSNERYALAARATNDGLWDWDLTQNRVYWGEGYHRTFGFRKSGDNDARFQNIHPEDLAVVRQSVEEAIADKNCSDWKAQYRYFNARNGTYSIVKDQGFVVRNSHGKALRMVGCMQDITYLKAQEQEILKQNNRLKAIARMNSHLVRKPVANILGILSLFETAEKKELSLLLKMLKESGRELDAMVRKIDAETRISEEVD